MTAPPHTGTADETLAYAIRLSALGLLCTIIISWPLYLPGFRIFTPAPLIGPLMAIPVFIDQCIYALCTALLLWLLVKPQTTIPAAGVVICLLFWALQDANRLQPYNYMYGYTFFISILCRNHKPSATDALRLMVSGVYFWAGFHKINMTFFLSIFPWFIEPIHHFSQTKNPSLLELPFVMALIATPFFEASIGILLLFPRRWRLATAMALTMLAVVLICLGPLGHNWAMVVWPWNIYLFLMEWRLFFVSSDSQGSLISRINYRNILSVILFMIAPVLAIWIPWYSSQIGFKLYSGNIMSAEIVFAPDETFGKVPGYIQSLIRDHRLSMNDWTVTELRNAVYPVPYVFETSARGLCPYLDDPKNAILNLYYPPLFYQVHRLQKSEPLCPPLQY